MRAPRLHLATLAVWLTPLATLAQDGTFDDPAISDRGPHSVSQRYIDPGNAQFSPHVAIRRVDPAAAQPAAVRATWTRVGLPSLNVQNGATPNDATTYEYRAPGIHALMDRPQYIVQDGPRSLSRNATPGPGGRYAPLAPANLVYSLMPDADATAPPTAEADPALDPRIDGRLDGRVQPLASSAAVPSNYKPEQTP